LKCSKNVIWELNFKELQKVTGTAHFIFQCN